jgi:hypothetical protein
VLRRLGVAVAQSRSLDRFTQPPQKPSNKQRTLLVADLIVGVLRLETSLSCRQVRMPACRAVSALTTAILVSVPALAQTVLDPITVAVCGLSLADQGLEGVIGLGSKLAARDPLGPSYCTCILGILTHHSPGGSGDLAVAFTVRLGESWSGNGCQPRVAVLREPLAETDPLHLVTDVLPGKYASVDLIQGQDTMVRVVKQSNAEVAGKTTTWRDAQLAGVKKWGQEAVGAMQTACADDLVTMGEAAVNVLPATIANMLPLASAVAKHSSRHSSLLQLLKRMPSSPHESLLLRAKHQWCDQVAELARISSDIGARSEAGRGTSPGQSWGLDDVAAYGMAVPLQQGTGQQDRGATSIVFMVERLPKPSSPGGETPRGQATWRHTLVHGYGVAAILLIFLMFSAQSPAKPAASIPGGACLDGDAPSHASGQNVRPRAAGRQTPRSKPPGSARASSTRRRRTAK